MLLHYVYVMFHISWIESEIFVSFVTGLVAEWSVLEAFIYKDFQISSCS